MMQGSPRPTGASARARVLGAVVPVLALAALAGHARAADPTPPASPAPTVRKPPPELALTWQAPATCPTAADVETQFVRLLGGANRTPSDKHVEASALVRSASSDRWSVELATVLDGAVGRRHLAGDSCASVSSAAALILALMIDPAAAERAILAPPASPPERAPPPAPRAPEAVVIAAPAPAPRALRGYARLFGGGVVALLPSPAPAAGLALGARRRRFSAEVSFVASGERRVGASASGDFRLLAGGGRLCGALGGRAVVWHLCAGGELERLTGTGLASPARTETVLMGAGTGGLLVEVPLGARLGLSLDLAGALRPYHPAFCAFCDLPADTGSQILRVPLVSGFAALGLFITI
jgi:hypothetical protein